MTDYLDEGGRVTLLGRASQRVFGYAMALALLLAAPAAADNPRLEAPRSGHPTGLRPEVVNPSALFDEKGEEGKDELEFNPAAVELRQTKKEVEAALKQVQGIRTADKAKLPASLEELAGRYDVPLAYNERIATWIETFRGPGRRYFTTWLARAHRFVPLFQPILRQYEAPEDLVYLSMVESGLSMQAVSWAGAAGPWQFMKPTAKDYQLFVNFWVDERLDPVKATHAAAQYLRDLNVKRKSWYLTWAEYNAGPAMVDRARRAANNSDDFWKVAAANVLLEETQNYIPKILAAAIIAKHPEFYGFANVTGLQPFDFEYLPVAHSTDLADLAYCAGTNEAVLRDLNPELLRYVTPPMVEGSYPLRVPRGGVARFHKCILPEAKFNYRGYRVRRGDSLRSIANRFRTDPKDIVLVNRIEPRIRVGQELIIPVPRPRPRGKGAKQP